MLSFGPFRFDPDTGELWRLSWAGTMPPGEATVLAVQVLPRWHAVRTPESPRHLAVGRSSTTTGRVLRATSCDTDPETGYLRPEPCRKTRRCATQSRMQRRTEQAGRLRGSRPRFEGRVLPRH